MDELKNEAVTGFIGSHFLEGVFHGKKYLTVNNGTHFYLASREPLTKEPVSVSLPNSLYYTDYTIDELEDLFRCRLNVKYRGHIFLTGLVSAGLEEFELLSPDIPYSPEQEAIEQEAGLTYDHELGGNHKIVPASELDDFILNRESIYAIVKAKIAGKGAEEPA